MSWPARFWCISQRSHPLHHPEPPRRQRQAVPADGNVFAGGVHRTPDRAAVALRHAVREFRNPQRIPRRAKAPEHVAMLVACLGNGKALQGEGGQAPVHDGRTGNSSAAQGVRSRRSSLIRLNDEGTKKGESHSQVSRKPRGSAPLSRLSPHRPSSPFPNHAAPQHSQNHFRSTR